MVLLQEREWSTKQWDELNDAMVRVASAAKQSQAKGWFKHIRVEDCMASIDGKLVRASRIDDDFVIVYGVGAPWYNWSFKALEEMLVIRLRKGSNYRKVLSALTILAEQHECKSIVVGDALTLDDRLARVYERAGFRRESSQFIKEI